MVIYQSRGLLFIGRSDSTTAKLSFFESTKFIEFKKLPSYNSRAVTNLSDTGAIDSQIGTFEVKQRLTRDEWLRLGRYYTENDLNALEQSE